MTQWIKLEDKLPEHEQPILVCNKNGGMLVVLFLLTEKVNKYLNKAGVKLLDNKDKYTFASVEVPGNVLNGVTHWMPLPKNPETSRLN